MSRSTNIMMSPLECATAAAILPKSVQVTKASPGMRRHGRWADCSIDSEYESEGYDTAGADEPRRPPSCWHCGASTDQCGISTNGPMASPTASMLGLPASMAISAGAINTDESTEAEKRPHEDVDVLADLFFREMLWRCEAATPGIVGKSSEAKTGNGSNMKPGRRSKSWKANVGQTCPESQQVDAVTHSALRRIDVLLDLLQCCRGRLSDEDISVNTPGDAGAVAELTVAAAKTDLSDQVTRKPNRRVRADLSDKAATKLADVSDQASSAMEPAVPMALDFGLPVAMQKSFCAHSLESPRSPDPFVMYEPLAEENETHPQKGAFGGLMSLTTAEVDSPCSQISEVQTPASPETLARDTSETLRQHLQILGQAHPERVLCLRKINRLGFGSRDLLERHYSQQGYANNIMVAHLFSRASRRRSARMRPASVGFMVMESEADAEAILALGETQTIEGFEILVQHFEPPKGEGTEWDLNGDE